MKPIRIEINNLFKYGTKNNIFEFHDGQLALIVGANGSGKSSIIESIAFCLFEETTRWGITKREILKRGAESGYAEFTFEHEGKVYCISRRRHYKMSGSVSLKCVTTNENWGKGTKEINKEIKNLIRFDFAAFSNSVLFGQHDLQKVIALTSGDRLELLSNFLGLNILNKALVKAKDKYFMVSNKLSSIDSQLQLMNKPKLKSELKSLKEIKNETEDVLEEVEEKFGNMQKLENKLGSMWTIFIKAEQNIKNANKEIKRLIEKKDELKESKKENKGDIDKIKKQYKKSEDAYEEIESLEMTISEVETKESELNEEYHEIKGETDNIRKIIKRIKGKKVCSECKRKYDEDTIRSLVKEHKDKLEKKIRLLDNVRAKVVKKNSELKKNQDKIKKIKSLPSPDSLLEQIERFEKLDKVNDEIVNIESEIVQKRKIIDINNNKIKTIKEEGFSLQRLEKLKKGLLKISGKVSEKREGIKTMGKRIDGIKTEIENTNTLEEKRDELFERSKRLDFISDMFSKTGGIRQIIIENILPALNEKINYYLDILTNEGISVEFTTRAKTKQGKFKNKLDIFINSPEGIANYEDYSGGEKQTIILAVGLGISELAAESIGMNCNMLLLDEVFGSLDDKARQRLIHLLFSLQKKFNSVIVISHIKELKTQMPEVISVRRKNGLSVINQ